ncbi:hypothetical protein M0802_010897 [Mischocyttarus mexicanus]|nr:hypothetical protein M0802_010897 [Mischocyttarus mexicanus]
MVYGTRYQEGDVGQGRVLVWLRLKNIKEMVRKKSQMQITSVHPVCGTLVLPIHTRWTTTVPLSFIPLECIIIYRSVLSYVTDSKTRMIAAKWECFLAIGELMILVHVQYATVVNELVTGE